MDDDREPIVEGGAEGFAARGRKGGKFMEGVPGVSHFTLQVENIEQFCCMTYG